MKLLDSQKIDIGHLTVVIGRYKTNKTPSILWEVVERGDAVAALVFNRQTRRLSFVQQSRPATLGKTYFPDDFREVMAGLIDGDETPESAVRRELTEELGYDVVSIEFIGKYFTSPGMTTEQTYIYYVEVDGERNGGGGIDGEVIQEYTLELDLVKSSLEHNVFEDLKTVVALQWFVINKLDNLLTFQ